MTGWLSAVGVVFGLAVALGAAIAVLRSSQAKGLIDLLQTENRALHDRADRLDAEADECKTRNAELAAQMHVLTELVTQAAAVSTLTKRVDEHHLDVVERLTRLDSVLALLGSQ